MTDAVEPPYPSRRGWYDDPDRPDTKRFFNGRVWTKSRKGRWPDDPPPAEGEMAEADAVSDPTPHAAELSGSEPRGNRRRDYWMVDALTQRGGKYRNALSGDRLAAFSFIGTQDWEDFASLSFLAMQVETITDLDMRMESLAQTMQRVESHLERIANALDPGRPTTH